MKIYIPTLSSCLLMVFSLWCNAGFAKNQEPTAYSAHLVIDNIGGQRINAQVTLTNNSEEKALTTTEGLGLYGQPADLFTIIRKGDVTKTPLRFRGIEAKRAATDNDEATVAQDTFDLNSLTNSFYVLQPDDFFVLNVELDRYYKFEGSGCYVVYYDALLFNITVGFAEEFRSNVVEFCF